LIALIINAHPTRQRIPGGRPSRTCVPVERTHGWTLIRKTSLSSDRSDGVRSSSRHKAALSFLRLATQVASDARRLRAARHGSPCGPSSRFGSRSDPTSSRCQISRVRNEPSGKTCLKAPRRTRN
jgi:hypothetical protein